MLSNEFRFNIFLYPTSFDDEKLHHSRCLCMDQLNPANKQSTSTSIAVDIKTVGILIYANQMQII